MRKFKAGDRVWFRRTLLGLIYNATGTILKKSDEKLAFGNKKHFYYLVRLDKSKYREEEDVDIMAFALNFLDPDNFKIDECFYDPFEPGMISSKGD